MFKVLWNLPGQLKYTPPQHCYNTIVLLFRFARSIDSYREQTVRIGMHSSNLIIEIQKYVTRNYLLIRLILRPEIERSYARDADSPLAIGHSKFVRRICAIEA